MVRVFISTNWAASNMLLQFSQLLPIGKLQNNTIWKINIAYNLHVK